MNAPDGPCRDAAVTLDLSSCMTKALKSADTKLNATYLRIQTALTEEEVKSLAKAERLWVQYRDANCNAEYSLYDGGTGGPPTRLACLEAETKTREVSLRRSFWWRVEKFSG
jgi:uncharacterized protein YecT (DUF1311 family)